MEYNTKQRFWKYTVIISLFIITFIILYGSPVNGDDWFFIRYGGVTLENIADKTSRYWHSLNGRVLGNLGSIVFSRYKLVRELVKAIIVFGTILFIFKCNLTEKENKKNIWIIITFILVFSMPKEIYRETYSWMSGFFNYVPPILIILIYIYMVRNIFAKQKIKDQWYKVVVSFTLGLLSQLYIENITIFTLIMSFFLIIWYWVEQNKISHIMLAHFLGSMIGGFIMFSSPTYRQMAQNEYGQRSISLGISDLLRTARANYEIFSLYSIRKEILLLVLISFACIIILYLNKRNGIKYSMTQQLSGVILIVTPIYAYITSKFANNIYISGSILKICLDGIGWMIYLLTISYVIYTCVKNISYRNRSIFFLWCALISVAPMLFVQPLGPRCFYISHIFIICVVINLLAYIDDELHIFNDNLICQSVCVIFIFVASFYVYIFGKIGYIDRISLDHINNEMKKGKSEIILPLFPYDQYIHEPYAVDKMGGHLYYYKTPEDIQFKYVSYDEWIKKYR